MPNANPLLFHLQTRVLARLLPRLGWRPPVLMPLNRHVLRATFGDEEETEIKRAIRTVLGSTGLGYERLASLWAQVRHLDRSAIPGALVECGVWRGGAVGMMALAHIHSGRPARELHLFDSFQGLPEPDPKVDGPDAVQAYADVENRAIAAVDYSRRLLEEKIGYPRELIRYHTGWFNDTVPAASVGPISLLRLDGDWYESTRICLRYLYPKVVADGLVVVDDYGYFEGCRRAVDEFRAQQPTAIYLHPVDFSARVWVKPV